MATRTGPFVHLHVHSQYSLLDGACRVADVVQRAKMLGQSALAVSDHGCLFGVVDFYNKAVAAGVKPIIGIETYIAPVSRRDRTTTGVKDGGYHLLLLAANRTGYANLLKLSTIAYTEGFYYKPRIDREVLKAHSEGLIATSACLAGEIPAALMQDNRKKAMELAQSYISIFGPDRFFIELQKHVPEQDAVNPLLIELADKLGIGVVASNDVHFLEPGDHAHHDVLTCIATGKLLSDESRMKYPTQLYLKSAQEMYDAWDHPRWFDACAATAHIAAMCDVQLDFKKSFVPVVKVERVGEPGRLGPGTAVRGGGDATAHGIAAIGSTAWYTAFSDQYRLLPFDESRDATLTRAELKQQCDEALASLANAGMVWRYGEQAGAEHRARLERELKVLADKNISAYFLIVWDFVNEARRRGIPALARGSGVGTMVGYCIGLSNACPVKYGLLFERFTDPDRSEYPDIDIDICQDGRQQIIDYVREKYHHVAQIITFGSLKARAALRDVGRVLNIPLPDVDKVCKLVGDALGTTIDKALEQEPDLKALYENDPRMGPMIDTARKIEGLSRHAGVHAAGVIIATQPLETIVPLATSRQGDREQLITQWDGPTCEKVGLLKMDFLGLRTLSIIERAKVLIRASLSPEVIARTVQGSGNKSEIRNQKSEIPADPLDLDRLTYDDQKVFDLFRRGETAGIFQFESGGMRNLLVGMKPDRLEDLIAANALFRPGPMDLIPDYIERKHGRRPVPHMHPIVQKHTAETYGIMVYQEQVMQIVHDLGGIPLRAAYTLIKNISKKKKDAIDAGRPVFVAGSQKQGLTKSQAEELFELILKFAGYGFNKSHSTGYAIVAYQTAYLKTYFPVQYMAALLTFESVSIDKVVQYVEECRRVMYPGGKRGIDVKPPDINVSDVGFNVVFDEAEPHDADHGHIRFGLSAVKGVGDKAIGSIIQARNADSPPPRGEGQGGGHVNGNLVGFRGFRGFRGLHDFCERVPLSSVTRATIEALIKCGAFDSIHGAPQRAALVTALDGAVQAGQRAAQDRDSGQMNFFGGHLSHAAESDSQSPNRQIAKSPNTKTAAETTLPRTPPWSPADQLKHEKSVLGFYLSSHPLHEHRDTIARFSSVSCADLEHLSADAEVVLGGMLTRVRQTLVKQGRSAGSKMAMIAIEDLSGSVEGVLFSDTYAVAAPLLVQDAMVFLKGKVDRRRERPQIMVNQVIPVEQAAPMLTQTVKVVLDNRMANPSPSAPTRFETASAQERVALRSLGEAGPGEGASEATKVTLAKLKELLRQATMSTPTGLRPTAQVVIQAHINDQIVSLRINGSRVLATIDLPERVETILAGLGRCELLGPRKIPISTQHAHEMTLSRPVSAEPALLRRHTADEEFCESIDRY